MTSREVLRTVNLGNSVAEFDDNLDAYFVRTQIYADFVAGRYDIVSGDKGTGKSAIFRVTRDNYRDEPQLHGTEIVAGFNDAGNPVFQRLAGAGDFSEKQYITIWKTYAFSLLGNYLVNICEGSSLVADEIERILEAMALRSKDSSPSGVFSGIVNLLRRLTRPKAAEVTYSVTESGMPIIAPRIEFSETEPEEWGNQQVITSHAALTLLNKLCEELGVTFWLVLDRLDEAFSGQADMEIPALRALLRTYLDMQEFPRLKLKLFVRDDLFRRVVHGGFVNLTHVNAKRVSITWSSEDLYAVLAGRLRQSIQFRKILDFDDEASDDSLVKVLIPDQVDVGEKKPTAWNWIISRIRDGNGNLPPRNLIDMPLKAMETQFRREERAPRNFTLGETTLLEADSLRRALVALSDLRVNDTLLAESGDLASTIELFRNRKSEHNRETLMELLGIDRIDEVLNELCAIGFLERIGDGYKIPMLYRQGLGVTQGKAFGQASSEE